MQKNFSNFFEFSEINPCENRQICKIILILIYGETLVLLKAKLQKVNLVHRKVGLKEPFKSSNIFKENI